MKATQEEQEKAQPRVHEKKQQEQQEKSEQKEKPEEKKQNATTPKASSRHRGDDEEDRRRSSGRKRSLPVKYADLMGRGFQQSPKKIKEIRQECVLRVDPPKNPLEGQIVRVEYERKFFVAEVLARVGADTVNVFYVKSSEVEDGVPLQRMVLVSLLHQCSPDEIVSLLQLYMESREVVREGKEELGADVTPEQVSMSLFSSCEHS